MWRGHLHKSLNWYSSKKCTFTCNFRDVGFFMQKLIWLPFYVDFREIKYQKEWYCPCNKWIWLRVTPQVKLPFAWLGVDEVIVTPDAGVIVVLPLQVNVEVGQVITLRHRELLSHLVTLLLSTLDKHRQIWTVATFTDQCVLVKRLLTLLSVWRTLEHNVHSVPWSCRRWTARITWTRRWDVCTAPMSLTRSAF